MNSTEKAALKRALMKLSVGHTIACGYAEAAGPAGDLPSGVYLAKAYHYEARAILSRLETGDAPNEAADKFDEAAKGFTDLWFAARKREELASASSPWIVERAPAVEL